MQERKEAFNEVQFKKILQDLDIVDKRYNDMLFTSINIVSNNLHSCSFFSSLWTIDIAHVLSLFNVRHAMYTITYGVNNSYETNSFYAKDNNFKSEEFRINNKFSQASQLGILKKDVTIFSSFMLR